MRSPQQDTPRLWINAGEVSGDMHAALLVRAFRDIAPEWEFLGLGGPALEAEGFGMEFSIHELSVMGFTEVLGALPRILGLLGRIRKRLKQTRPRAVVLLDSPDFNFQVARMAHGLGIPVFFYISPQVWAWRQGRVKFLRRTARRVISILPFEKAFYAERGMDVDFVGHPLLDHIPLAELDTIAPEPRTVGILPGSRSREISSLLPEFMGAARLLKRTHPDLRFEMARAPGVAEQTLRGLIPPDLDVDLVPPEERYRFMRRAGLLLAASGTVTLEAALIGTPTVVAYKLSGLTFLLGRMLVNVDHVSLPNLILGERVFPELLQDDARAEALARHAALWLDNEAEQARVRDKLARLRAMMGQPGAPARAARIILDRLDA